MSKIAIDVVLLPPKAITDLCIGINKESFRHGKGRFVMSEDDFVPHVSLMLGCIKEEELQNVIKEVELIFQTQKPLKINIEEVELIQRDDGKRGWLKIDVSERLRSLRKNIFDAVKCKLVKCESSDVLVEGDITGLSDTSKKILNNYGIYYENYNPHITLCGYDSDRFVGDISFPIEFVVSKVAVFQVGDGCTCRKLLWFSDLS